MSSGTLAIVGAGGHAKVVIDIVECAAGQRIVGIFDDAPATWGRALAGYPVIGGVDVLLADWRHRCDAAIVAIGDNGARHTIARRLAEQGVPLATVAHPTAVVARTARLGPGTVVMPLAVLNAGAVVGTAGVVNTSASVDHDCRLGDAVFVGPGARLCGGVRVGDLALIGTGATVIPGRTIGPHARVGAGAVVVDDVPAGLTVVGVPARPVGLRAAHEPLV